MSTSFNSLIIEIGEIVRDTALSSRIGREINNFIRKVNRKKEWSWNKKYEDFNLVADTRDYSLPTDCKKVISLIGEYGQLSSEDPTKFFVATELYSIVGNYAAHYTVPGRGAISFLPIPTADKVIKIRYVKKFTELNAEVGDLPIDTYFPEDYKDVLVNYVVWMILTTQNDIAKITYEKLFSEGWLEMVGDDEPDPANKTRMGSAGVKANTLVDHAGFPKYGVIT